MFLLEGIFLAWQGIALGSLFLQTVIPWSVRASTWALRLQHPEEQPGRPGAAPAPAPSLYIPGTADGSRPARPPARVEVGHVLEHEKQSQLKMRGRGKCEENLLGVRQALPEPALRGLPIG